jgi:hypothetical protein
LVHLNQIRSILLKVPSQLVTLCRKKLKLSADIRRRAGISSSVPFKFNTEETLWLVDDGLWFETHPQRAHRARRAYAGEMSDLATVKPGWHLVALCARSNLAVG